MRIIIQATAILLSASFFISSCSKAPDGPVSGNGKVIYVGNNDYHAGKNAILAYRQKSNGSLEPIPGSPFLTGGAGIGNPGQVLGPDDSDFPIIISSDGHYLLAVNPGSNTIAVFQIESNGSLNPVPGSPFPSGGQTPVSLAQLGNYLYVVNKSQDPLHPSTENPNYIALTLSATGKLIVVPGSKFEVAPGVSPSQILVANNQKFLFGTDFLAFMGKSPASLRSFTTQGPYLQSAPNSPQVIAATAGGALGLWQHPYKNILYVGFPVTAQVGVYGINNTSGELTFKKAIDAGAAACWIRTNKEGDRLYVLNSAENTVGIYNSADASSPVFVNKLALKYPGPLYPAGNGAMFTTSEDFSLNFSPDGRYLYVISQHTNTDFSIGNFNYLHILTVKGDGTLAEETEPVHLPVAADIRPQGVVVY